MAVPPPPGAYPPAGGGYPPPGGQYPYQGQPQDPDIQANKVQAVLAYIGILVLVPILAAKESRFARFHANQGLALFIGEVVVGIIDAILVAVLPLALSVIITLVVGLVALGLVVLSIIGIVAAAQGQYKKLPLVGNITILH